MQYIVEGQIFENFDEARQVAWQKVVDGETHPVDVVELGSDGEPLGWEEVRFARHQGEVVEISDEGMFLAG